MEFSLENTAVLKAREKRMEKSREKNPLWKKSKHSTNENKGKENLEFRSHGQIKEYHHSYRLLPCVLCYHWILLIDASSVEFLSETTLIQYLISYLR